MKKVLVALFALMLTSGVFAQDSTHDGAIMKDGKMLLMKNGQAIPLTQDLVLANGTIITAVGTVKMKDGTTTTLKEGDYVLMDGTRGKLKMKKDNMSKDTLMPVMKTDTLR